MKPRTNEQHLITMAVRASDICAKYLLAMQSASTYLILSPYSTRHIKQSVDALKLDTPVDTGDQDHRVSDIEEYAGNTDEDIYLTIHQCSVPNASRSVNSMKICQISWNIASINAPFPKLC